MSDGDERERMAGFIAVDKGSCDYGPADATALKRSITPKPRQDTHRQWGRGNFFARSTCKWEKSIGEKAKPWIFRQAEPWKKKMFQDSNLGSTLSLGEVERMRIHS